MPEINQLTSGGQVYRFQDSEMRKPEKVAELGLLRDRMLYPIYVGDYFSDGYHLPSCCLRMGNYIYTFDAAESSYSAEQGTEDGIIRKFDLANNVEVTDARMETPLGHANSVAYDPIDQIVYVCPLRFYAQTPSVTAYAFYRFDSNMQPLEMEYIPDQMFNPHMVSYDPVTQNLYAFGYSSHDNVYVRNRATGTWEFYTTIDVPKENTVHNIGYDQDFAVYNNYWFRSSVKGNIIWGKLEPGTSNYIGGFTFGGMDSNGKWALGELEGMEFDSNGHLYATCFTQLSSDAKNAFVTELPVGIVRAEGTAIPDSDRTFASSMTLSEETQKKFALTLTQVRSVQQLEAKILRNNISEVQIPLDNNVIDNGIIRINDRIKLTLYGKYTCSQIDIYGGALNISCMTSMPEAILTFLTMGTPIRLYRTGELMITGTSTMRVAHPNNNGLRRLVDVGYDYNRTTIRIRPQDFEATGGENRMLIGNNWLNNDCVYRGQQEIVMPGYADGRSYLTNDYITRETMLAGYNYYMFAGSLSTASLDVTVSASIPQGTKVSFVRCSAKPPRHLIAQYLVGSDGTLTLFEIDTDGSCSLTPINQDSGATERFACSLVVPC